MTRKVHCKMSFRTKIVLLVCLLFHEVLMEEVDPVISELRARPRQQIKVLEESMKEVQEVIKKQDERMKEQEETIKEQEKKMKDNKERIKDLEECKACSKIEELNETLTELQEKVDSTLDIDECASGVHECHRFASCINTVGSYTCSCNRPYTGDGKTCTQLPEECQNYQSLASADRKITYGTGKVCDSNLGPGWFRFQGAAGTRMPTSCPPKSRCNTDATGWLSGGHPSVADGQVTRQVCFHWVSNCCWQTTDIQVRNCGSFYVYYFNGAPDCYLRYCGTD